MLEYLRAAGRRESWARDPNSFASWACPHRAGYV